MPAPAATQKSRLVPAVIESGVILDVDIENYTLTVQTQYTVKVMSVGFMTPYQHYANGEGMYFMPEVGGLVWICFPSDGSNPFVMGWQAAREENGSLRSFKQGLNPGDLYLGTRDENFLILRRGGVVQVGGGPLCQRMFIPVSNIIKDFCENYSLQTPGGDLEWTVDRSETTTDGHRPAHLRVKAREFADDAQPIAYLEIGSHTDNPANILSLVINASGEKGAAKKISMEFRKDGTVAWTFAGNTNWTVNESLSIRAKKNMDLLADQIASLTGATVKVTSKSGNVEVNAKALAQILAGSVVAVGPQLVVGGGTSPGAGTPALLADGAFMTWLLGHKHLTHSPGSMSDPPIPPTGTGHISKSIFGK